MRVRSAEARDFDAVTDLLAEQLGRSPVTDETREACRAVYDDQLADSAADHLVAEDDAGRVVGFCSLHFRPRLNEPRPQGWVPDLVVHEDARRGGAGQALLEEAERRARAAGCETFTLESGFQRTDAHRLYERMGMAKPGWYFAKRLG
jgi:GNAT superfamily N-acetyltransferase